MKNNVLLIFILYAKDVIISESSFVNRNKKSMVGNYKIFNVKLPILRYIKLEYNFKNGKSIV